MKPGRRPLRAPAILPSFLPPRLAAALRRGARCFGAVRRAIDLAGAGLTVLGCFLGWSWALRFECQTFFFCEAISSIVRPVTVEFGISSRMSGSDFLRANSSLALIR